MKAITYSKDRDRFVMQTLPLPPIKSPYDVRVKVHAVGLNPVDAKIHHWHTMVPDMDDQFVGGLDVAGEICAVGDAVTDWKVGDYVLYHGDMRRAHGGFAEYAIQDARTLIAHPNVASTLAAATPCAGWTAYRALVDKLHVPHNSLLIMGGAGGVGSFALQLARRFDVETIIATGSAEKHNYLRSLGATHTLDYRTQNIPEQVMQITGQQGVEAALDAVGGENAKLAALSLGFEGQMVELVDTINAQQYPGAFLKGLSFHQLSLGSGHVNGVKGHNSIVRAGVAFSTLLEMGAIRVPQLDVIALDDIGDALMTLREQRTLGKVVARITG